MSDDKKSKLQQEYDKANSKEKNLEEEEATTIKDYQMKEGSYKILITVYEASELQPRPANFLLFQADKSACDAFVEVEVRGEKKRTHVREGTNNPIWQESFYFHFENMSVQELDRSKITFNVYDKNHFIIANSHLAQFELDWTNVYFRRFHEIYRGWLTLSDPREESEGPVGYLLVNIAVLGPEDKIMVHDSAFIKDPLTTIEDTITNPKTPLIDYALTVEIYRAESLVPLDLAARNVDAYVVAKFSGNKVNTSVITSLNPEWNQALKIATGVPNKTKYLMIEVWNYNLLGGDDLIGVLKVPFIDICEDENPTPRWGHLYGPPMCAKDEPPANYATKMQIYGEELGSHYRGRLLYKVVGKKYVHSRNGKNDIKFKFPFKPTPVVPLKTYTLSMQMIEGFQLPVRQQAIVQVAMGQYLIKSKSHLVKNGLCEFMEIMEDKKVQFPEDLTQVPDVIIYFSEGREERNRMSFVRIKAAKVATAGRHKHAKIYEMCGDKSLNLLQGNELGGYVTCRVNLYTDAVPANRMIESDYKEKLSYSLMFYLYKGEEFPPANIEGDCDPFIRFNCYGESKDSRAVKGSFNPFWRERVEMEVQLQDVLTTNITKGIVCEAYDHEENGNHQFIGSFLLELSSQYLQTMKSPNGEKVDFLYRKPKWYYAVNPHVEVGRCVFGRVLMAVALFRKEDILKGRIPKELIFNDNLIPTEEKTIQVYLIGLRDIRDSSKKILSKGSAEVVMRVGEDQEINVEAVELKRSGCEINKLCEAKVKLPKNKTLTPFIDFKVMNNGKFYGFNSISLYTLLPKLKEKDSGGGAKVQNEDSEETILDVEGLEQQLEMIKEKRKKDKLMNEVGDHFQGKNIENLPAPLEMGMPREEIDKNNVEFDNILKLFETTYANDESYLYVRELEKKHDRQQESRKQSLLAPADDNLKEPDAPVVPEASEFEESKLMPPSRKDMEESTSRLKSSLHVNATVFDKMRMKIENRQSQQTPRVARPSLAGLEKTKEKETLMAIKEVDEKEIEPQLGQSAERTILLKRDPENQSDLSQPSGSFNKLEEEKGENKLITDRKAQIIAVNNELQIKKSYNEAKNRFSTASKGQGHGALAEESENIHFDIRTDQQFSDTPVRDRAIVYANVERVMQQEDRDEKEARERDEQYRFGQAVKLTLFGWNRKKKRKDIETYEDYDTEEGEDLNIIPEWYKGRKILSTDLEDLNFKGRKIQTIPLYGGRKIENSPLQAKGKDSAGHIKLIMMSQPPEIAKEKEQYYGKLLKPKEYYCRIYILKGKSLISGYDSKPSTYLRFTYSDDTVSLKDTTFVKDENNPEYYICHELPLYLPGPCLVRIEVMETHHLFGKLIERVLGFTDIDLQQRYFMKKWHLYEKKPIELRNLYSEYGMGTQGRLQTWIDLIEKKKWLSTPAHKIHPPPFDEYELRVIVWQTDDCVFKNVQMQSNDIFVRGVVGTSEFQETDTHWCCRSVGNFNYRFKFPVNYPPKPEDMYSDVFTVQIWDRDLVGYNNLIGEKRINLNQIHRIIEKAVKRKKPVRASMKIKEKNFAITDRFWFDVYNHKEKDEFGIPQPQGRVQLGFELVPMEKAQKELENGYGRSEPNVYPTLAEPAGRLQFDLFSPLSFIKQIIGPKLYARWCCRLLCCLLLVLLCLFGYIFLPTLLAVKI